MKLQTPKKRRKLYSGKKDTLEDFYDMDEGYTAAIQSSIEGILNILEDDKVDYTNFISYTFINYILCFTTKN